MKICFKSTNTGYGVALWVRRSSRTGAFGAKGSRSDIRTYFMHILGQLIWSEAALVFISAENSGWVSISLLLIISFAFDLYYGCSVRHSFIHHCWWRDGAFRDGADWNALKMASEDLSESTHTDAAVILYGLLSVVFSLASFYRAVLVYQTGALVNGFNILQSRMWKIPQHFFLSWLFISQY